MSNWSSRSYPTYAQRERAARKQQREAERRAKEHAKLSAMEQARAEVEVHENQIAVLLSVHKEPVRTVDWLALLSALPPPQPVKRSQEEIRMRQHATVAPPKTREQELAEAAAAGAARDEQLFQRSLTDYNQALFEWNAVRTLAEGVSAGKSQSYREALREFSGLDEISDFGASLDFEFHDARIVECQLRVQTSAAIPAETKSLTSSGKLSVKATPRQQFHELYQDYVCSCILRLAREAFAVLPISTLIVTASTDVFDSASGSTSEQPVLSVVFHREGLARLHFDFLDPSDAVETFVHRGDFKASRKGGAFVAIRPLLLSDIKTDTGPTFEEVLAKAQTLHAELTGQLAELGSNASRS